MKMETPKMDVVRFQEADVLAASGFATLSGSVRYAGDSANDTLEVYVNNDSYYDYERLAKGQGDHVQELGKVKFTVVTASGSSTATIADLFADNINNGLFDGDYLSTDGGWEYIRHQ